MSDMEKLRQLPLLIKPASSLCNWLPICHGGCKKDITAGCHNEPENYFCPAYRFFFEYASERLMEVAQEEFRAMQGRR